MTPQQRTDFLNNRKTGIGGSDIASLLQPYLSEVKYGCRLRLWREKSGQEPDYPQDDSGPMQLGRILEPWVAQWHAEATGDTLSEVTTVRHPKHSELLVNIDRVITTSKRPTPGVAEIKALGPDMFFQTKREGILVDYMLQVQHGTLCAGLDWGRFIVGNRAYGHDAKHPPLAWDVEKDPDIHEAILEEGPAFWKTLGDESKAPARLDIDDKRCQTCQWRRSCQGNALVKDETGDIPVADDLVEVLERYDAAKEAATAAEEGLEAVKEELKTALVDRPAVKAGERKVYYRAQDGRVSWETAELVKKYGAMRGLARAQYIADRPNEVAVGGKFDTEYPSAEKFKRQGVPFRVLRVY